MVCLSYTSLLIFLAVVALAVFVWLFLPVGPWIQAKAVGVDVGLTRLFAMRLRRVDPARILHPLITAHKAGLPLNATHLEAHHLAGGNVERVVQALILAQHTGVALDFRQASAIDLAGHDVLEVVRSGPRRPDGSIDHPAVPPRRE